MSAQRSRLRALRETFLREKDFDPYPSSKGEKCNSNIQYYYGTNDHAKRRHTAHTNTDGANRRNTKTNDTNRRSINSKGDSGRYTTGENRRESNTIETTRRNIHANSSNKRNTNATGANRRNINTDGTSKNTKHARKRNTSIEKISSSRNKVSNCVARRVEILR